MPSQLIYVIIATFIVFTTQISKKTDSLDTLELVHVIFRHGDRTPDKATIYPNDPHKNYSYYPVGFGQLTNAGKRKEYILGKALRKRYGKFLGNYNIETVDARCTDYNRTKMSLQLVLASLFPPQDELVWEKRLKWQPIPFNYWTIKDDHVLGDPSVNCPKYLKKYSEYMNSLEAYNFFKNYSTIRDYLTENIGKNSTSKVMAELYFTLTTEKENGLKLPDWTDTVYPEILKHFAILDYNISTLNPEMRKLASGFLVKKIIDDSLGKIKDSSRIRTKMYLYSAHEFNLAYLLRFLGIFHPHVPPYGAYLTIEIHNLNGIREIRIFYQDYRFEKPKRYKIPNCDSNCRLAKFFEIVRNNLPHNEAECYLH